MQVELSLGNCEVCYRPKAAARQSVLFCTAASRNRPLVHHAVFLAIEGPVCGDTVEKVDVLDGLTIA